MQSFEFSIRSASTKHLSDKRDQWGNLPEVAEVDGKLDSLTIQGLKVKSHNKTTSLPTVIGHTPLPIEAVADAMETLFECAQQEPHPLTRAILCHWLIGYIHPYPDGNG